MESNKKGIGRIERLVLFVVIAIVAYMIIKGVGFNIIERTEEGGFIDRNGTGEIIQLLEQKNAFIFHESENQKIS